MFDWIVVGGSVLRQEAYQAGLGPVWEFLLRDGGLLGVALVLVLLAYWIWR